MHFWTFALSDFTFTFKMKLSFTFAWIVCENLEIWPNPSASYRQKPHLWHLTAVLNAQNRKDFQPIRNYYRQTSNWNKMTSKKGKCLEWNLPISQYFFFKCLFSILLRIVEISCESYLTGLKDPLSNEYVLKYSQGHIIIPWLTWFEHVHVTFLPYNPSTWVN